MAFRYQVKWGSAVMSFEEVSGLDATVPGSRRVGSITMKRGVFKSSQTFGDWFNQFKMNAGTRAPATISILDASGRPSRSWTLTSARPAKFEGPALNAQSNEVAIESIEIAHEGLSLAST